MPRRKWSNAEMHSSGRRMMRRLSTVVAESIVLGDLFRRRDLNRRQMAMWFSGVTMFPRAGTVAYIAARPQTRAALSRVRVPVPHRHGG